MGEQILDTQINNAIQRKPAVWWLIGIVAGLFSIITLLIIMVATRNIEFPSRTMVLLASGFFYFAPTLVGALYIALWGSRGYHFVKILGCCLIGLCLPLIMILWVTSLELYPSIPSFPSANVIIALFTVVFVISSIAASILQFFPAR